VAETVSNTSPLSYLHRLGRLELLRDLFGRVFVPTAVEVEIERGRALGYDLPDLRGVPWIEVRPVEGDAFEDLGAGETGVLNLARALPDPLVILDDAAARSWALRLGFRLTGSLGVLVDAKARGLMGPLAPELNRLQALGFRITPAVCAVVLKACGEG
jgi:uncharacterized protein